jgi:hypothetical protein
VDQAGSFQDGKLPDGFRFQNTPFSADFRFSESRRSAFAV